MIKIFNMNQVNLKKINLTLLVFISILFGYYIYQAISISSGKVNLISLKKEFFERKNNLSQLISAVQQKYDFSPDFIKTNFKMTEIEKFDYLIIGPSEFVLIKNGKTERSEN